MDNRDKALVELLKVAKKQQEIIKKLAQDKVVSINPDKAAVENEAEVIMNSMDAATRAAVSDVWVTSDNVVKVKFNPGKGSDEAWNGVQKAVQLAQTQNKLTSTGYQIQEVM